MTMFVHITTVHVIRLQNTKAKAIGKAKDLQPNEATRNMNQVWLIPDDDVTHRTIVRATQS